LDKALSCLNPLALAEYFLRTDMSCEMELMLPVTLLPPGGFAYCGTLALTLAIELPFYYFLGRLSGASRKRVFCALILCNLATHPAVHFLILPFAGLAHWRLLNFILVSESFAAVGEILLSLGLLRTKWWQAALLVGAANLTSWSFS
jgi:hypothetical protein